ncbi:MAG: sulfatase-like hydrolase/transferase [Verrucomicrobiota bacterium]
MTPIPVLLLVLSLLLTSAAAKPNIILVMADDQGWGDMGYNGHPDLITPNFDMAAASGMRFDRFYAAAPVCSPTRASVLTGRHPNRMGVFKWGNTLRPQEITIAEALKAGGYATGHFGKWHLGSVRKGSPVSPGGSGFDEWLSAPNFYDNDPILSDKGRAVKLKGESSEIAANASIEWMKGQVAAKKPFLSVVWFGSPHGPHIAAAEDRSLYPGHRDADFLGEITGMDRAFGMIRDSLDELGIRENTILWYCSDNGALPRMGATGGFRGNKGKVYEGGLLVPSILEWPAKIADPVVISRRCNTSDIFPTLLEVAGLPIQERPVLDGMSLAGLLNGTSPDLEERAMGFWDFPIGGKSMRAYDMMEEVLEAQEKKINLPPAQDSLLAAEIDPLPKGIQQYFGHAAWISGNWKLHWITDPKTEKRKHELYDLVRDPYEENDLSKAEVERVGKMGADLESWLKSVVSSLEGMDY